MYDHAVKDRAHILGHDETQLSNDSWLESGFHGGRMRASSNGYRNAQVWYPSTRHRRSAVQSLIEARERIKSTASR